MTGVEVAGQVGSNCCHSKVLVTGKMDTKKIDNPMNITRPYLNTSVHSPNIGSVLTRGNIYPYQMQTSFSTQM